MPPPKTVTVGVITRDRPESLLRLLESLRDIGAETQPFEVLVVDNSETGSAKPIIDDFDAPVSIRYVVEHRQGIPIARNRVLAETTTDHLAFVDDDEAVRPGWLSSLVAAASASGAEAVRGPVFERTAPGIPKWVARSTYLVSSPLLRDRPSLSTPTNNVMVSMPFVRKHDLRFDEWRPMMGGSDIEFFRRFTEAGGVVEWCENAMVDEYVQPSRGVPRAVLERSFRRGFVPTIRRRKARAARWRITALMRAGGFIFEGFALLSLTPTRGKAAVFAAARQISTGLGIVWAVGGRDFDYYQDVHV